MSLAVDNNKTFVIDQSDRNQACLAVILPIIDPGDNSTFENLRRIEKIHAVLVDHQFSFVFIPFEFQNASLKLCNSVIRDLLKMFDYVKYGRVYNTPEVYTFASRAPDAFYIVVALARCPST